MAPKKIDRRIIYTKNAIKESFLQIKAVKDYNTITITDICRKAEISRSTFYLHYGNVSEVLDELIDDLMANVSGLMEHLLHEPQKEGSAQCTWPMCQFLRMNQKYHCIFLTTLYLPALSTVSLPFIWRISFIIWRSGAISPVRRSKLWPTSR